MILLKIQGGLCNQLFQWACGKNLSRQHEVFFDLSFFDQNFNYTKTTQRHYLLNEILSTKAKVADDKLIKSLGSQNFHTIIDDFKFKKLKLNPQENYILDGYWQSEKYFFDSKNEIINSFFWPETKNFDFKNSCSIHVRRDDYLKAQHVHPVQSIDYYNKALDIIQPKGNIFIFSDDINWCKQNLHFKKSIFMENNTNIQDLKYMSLCEDNIIANSSFSWWGAWLNQNKNKKVVCPKTWFGDQTNDSDIKLKQWKQI